jgi:hypothetical protein
MRLHQPAQRLDLPHAAIALGENNTRFSWQLRHAGDARPHRPRYNAFDQPYAPPALAAVDRQRDFRIGRRVSGRIPQDEEVGTELADRQDKTIHMELHANIGGITSGR